MSRPIVLTLVGCYLPGYKAGGPVRSVANMVERLGDEFDFRIITADRDLSDTEPYPSVMVDAWNEVGKARVYYMSPKARSIRGFARLMRETPHDVLYANSFFSPVFTLRPLLARILGLAPKVPMIIAPRGEFSKGAIALKAWKKRPYLMLSRTLHLYDGLTWHASSEYEAEDIRREFGSGDSETATGLPIVAMSDLAPPVAVKELQLPVESAHRPLRIAFLSRIVRKKNLDFALRVLSSVTAEAELSVYGVVEDEVYWQQCRELIDALQPHTTVLYRGEVPHALVVDELATHEIFLFPTRGENYGHVIHEALAAGLPVLLSDQTPWRNLTERGVGWALPLSEPEAFAAVIDSYARLSMEERAAFGARARAFAAQVSEDDDAVASNVALFRSACGHADDLGIPGREHDRARR